jgi:hypothetical protein
MSRGYSDFLVSSLVILAAVALSGNRVRAQDWRNCPPPRWDICPPSPCPPLQLAPEALAVPTEPGQPAPATAPTAPAAPAAAEPSFAGEQFAALGGGSINMMGDLIASPALRCVFVPETILVPVTLPPPPPPPPPPRPRPGTFAFQPAPAPPAVPAAQVVLVPVTIEVMKCAEVLSSAARASSFKIAEDESALPQDRIYFGFNYFNDVNQAINQRLGGNVNNIDVYRETFGIEKTFLDRHASIEFRLPLATLDVDSNVPGLGGSDTDIGDISVDFKYAPYIDFATGNVIAGGLVVTAPTGPSEFNPFGDVILQPWAGYKWGSRNLFIQEFCSLAVPTDSRDVTLLFNDIELAYYLYRNSSPDAWISAIVPLFEVHVNTPLNHRGIFRIEEDPMGTPDWVTLTTGTTFEVGERATVAVGGAIPVTGPRPYDFEILAQVNLRF